MRSFAVLVLGFVALTALALPAAAQYPPVQPDADVSDDTVVGGEAITVSGGGFEPGAEVVVSGCGLEEVTVEVDDAGDFTLPITIPAEQEPGACVIEVSGEGQDGEPRVVEQRVTVVAPGEEAADEQPAAGPAGGVADTGLDLATGVALAAALLLFGAGAVVIGRARA